MGGLWPNLVVPGVPKAGTSALHRALGQHPEVFTCPVEKIGFFSRTWDRVEDDPEAFGDEERAYLETFEPGRDHPVRCETSPGYFTHPEAPARIRETVPDVRLLFILRDPVDRARSWWGLARGYRAEIGGFSAFVDRELDRPDPAYPGFLPPGRYGTHLERWMKHVDRDRILTVVYDDLVQDPSSCLAEVAAFLDVDPGPMRDVDVADRHDPSPVPRNALAGWLRRSDRVARLARKVLSEEWRVTLGDEVLAEEVETPPIDATASRRLARYYEPEIARLEELLGRSVPELRRTWPDEG